VKKIWSCGITASRRAVPPWMSICRLAKLPREFGFNVARARRHGRLEATSLRWSERPGVAADCTATGGISTRWWTIGLRRGGWWRWRRWRHVVGAFLAGRVSQRQTQVAGLSGPVRERIMLVAVGEHLEQSQMILIELMNSDSKGTVDISEEQLRAQDLISENRLYRQAALRTGDKSVSNVLDELERVLLEVAHSPSKLNSAEFEQIRQRIAADGILFKIRVVGSNLRERKQCP
jgi:hypothetical protein